MTPIPIPTPTFLTVGSLIIDDIVLPDGSIAEAQLGGGGVHALFGMRMHLPPPLSRSICYIANIGNDCPPSVVEKLRNLDIEMVERAVEHPTPRAWNRFKEMGGKETREFEFRTSEGGLWEAI
ncbi:hypothetical protein HDV00_003396 [Rhizophlyctis rosea]|nr:hypothetical protein HDV00_003396 [Rhizophlyctis rosea]